VKADLRLTDTEIGLIGGLGFALLYASLGLPLAWVADRKNRVTLLAACLAVWSVATAACGLAANFMQLLLARIGVGAGEAGCVPTSHSIIGDSFPKSQRAFAVGMIQSAGNAGFLAGIMASGVLAEAVGWRTTFLLLGVPGILFAAAFKATVKEPSRGAMDSEAGFDPAAKPGIAALWSRPAFRHLVAALTLSFAGFYSVLFWLPQFYARAHAMSPQDIGLRYGLAMGVGMILGSAIGALSSRPLIDRDQRWEMWFPSLSILACLPFFVLAVGLPDPDAALTCTFVGSLLYSVSLGPGLAAIQSLAEPSVRATAAAIVLLISGVFSQGLAPTLVGVGSDLMSSSGGENGLVLSLHLVQISFAWAAIHFYLGSRHWPGRSRPTAQH
jgi:MFS family permease